MGDEGLPVREAFCHCPALPLWQRRDREGKTARLGQGQAEMIGQKPGDQGRILWRRTAQRAGQADHSHSMVAGGLLDTS